MQKDFRRIAVCNSLALDSIYGAGTHDELEQVLAEAGMEILDIPRDLRAPDASSAKSYDIARDFQRAYRMAMRSLDLLGPGRPETVVYLIGGKHVIPFQPLFLESEGNHQAVQAHGPCEGDYPYTRLDDVSLLQAQPPVIFVTRLPDEVGFSALGITSPALHDVGHDPYAFSQPDLQIAKGYFLSYVRGNVPVPVVRPQTKVHGGATPATVLSAGGPYILLHSHDIANSLGGNVVQLPATVNQTVTVWDAHGAADATVMTDDAMAAVYPNAAEPSTGDVTSFVVCHAGDLTPHDSFGHDALLTMLASGAIGVASPNVVFTGLITPLQFGLLATEFSKQFLAAVPGYHAFRRATSHVLTSAPSQRSTITYKSANYYGNPFLTLNLSADSGSEADLMARRPSTLGHVAISHSLRLVARETNQTFEALRATTPYRSPRQAEKQHRYFRRNPDELRRLLITCLESELPQTAPPTGDVSASSAIRNLVELVNNVRPTDLRISGDGIELEIDAQGATRLIFRMAYRNGRNIVEIMRTGSTRARTS
ncbi:MAG: hypothetical protein SFX74_09225 [Fimbriimonadaceae bacterium]|nr:hypothetical protein [Fimbriimonadaceae bacterium]